MFLQLSTPVPSPVQPNPTIPGGGNYPYGGGGSSGSYLNPANYAGLAHELGPVQFVLLTIIIMLALALAYMVWRSWKQPSNATQLAYLKAMYVASNNRHTQWQFAMRQFCTILSVFAKKNDIDLNGKLDDLREAITAPPPVPDELLSVLGNDDSLAKRVE